MKYQIDYKGKWFTLQDNKPTEDDFMDFVIGTMEDEEITDTFLREHVEACRYYGIPAYCGNDKKLKERVEKFYEEGDKQDFI